jgi:hypothetical protein
LGTNGPQPSLLPLVAPWQRPEHGTDCTCCVIDPIAPRSKQVCACAWCEIVIY